MTGPSELLATMAVIAAGTLFGRLQLHGIRLDVAAMLIVGVVAAHLGITLSPELGTFGLLLFLYTVGVQAGPALRRIHRREVGLAAIGLSVMLSMLVFFVGTASLVGLPKEIAYGAFAGFFGSGAAIALLENHFHNGAAAGAFALTAPATSLLGMIVVQLLRAKLQTPIDDERRDWNAHLRRSTPLTSAVFAVDKIDIIDTPLRRLNLPFQVVWIERSGKTMQAKADSSFQLNDMLHVAGTVEQVALAEGLIGTRIKRSKALRSREMTVRVFFVSNPTVLNRRLQRLMLRLRHEATILSIRRAGLAFPARPGSRLRWGDRVVVSFPVGQADALATVFGDDAQWLDNFAFPRAALVVFVGGAIGLIPVTLSHTSRLHLGPALGVLLFSMITSALHRTGPIVWSQSASSRKLLAQIGLPLFLAQIGNSSYQSMMGTLNEHGWTLVVVAALGTPTFLLLIYVAGRRLKLGALTLVSLMPSISLNTPALSLIQDAYREKIPSQVYAAVYPVVTVSVVLTAFVLSLL